MEARGFEVEVDIAIHAFDSGDVLDQGHVECLLVLLSIHSLCLKVILMKLVLGWLKIREAEAKRLLGAMIGLDVTRLDCRGFSRYEFVGFRDAIP